MEVIDIQALEIPDSRGNPTLEVSLTCLQDAGTGHGAWGSGLAAIPLLLYRCKDF